MSRPIASSIFGSDVPIELVAADPPAGNIPNPYTVGVSTPCVGTKSAPRAQTITTTAAQILAANPNRLAAFFANNGSTTLYLGRDSTVNSSSGIPLAAGAVFADLYSSDAWFAVVASSSTTCGILEIA